MIVKLVEKDHGKKVPEFAIMRRVDGSPGEIRTLAKHK
jgi:hypothetical protein